MIAYKYIGIWKAKQINPKSGKEKKKEKKEKKLNSHTRLSFSILNYLDKI